MDIILTESQIKTIIQVINESISDEYKDDEVVGNIINYLYDNKSLGFKKIKIIDFVESDNNFEKKINLIGLNSPYTGENKLKLSFKMISYDKNLPSSIKKIVLFSDEPNGFYYDPSTDKFKNVIFKREFNKDFYKMLFNELKSNFVFDYDRSNYVPEPEPQKSKKESDIILFDEDFVNYVEQVALKDSHPSAKKALRIIGHIRKNNGYGNKSMKQDLERYLRGEL